MAEPDNGAAFCRGTDNDAAATLPRYARLPINRCNLPAVILGSLTFQRHPAELLLDGVAELHADLFLRLDRIVDRSERAAAFRDYLTVHFRLEHLDEAGLTDQSQQRANANWMRALRGWSFDSDGREGAVLKGWVESRFGLLPRFHAEPLRDFSGPGYRRYQEMRAAGLYGTNALEGQLDLLYAYCQYEFRRNEAAAGIELYRGINRIGDHEVLSGEGRRQVVLFNNLASFTGSRERAGEFGDYILATRVPAAKIFFHCGLLPGVLKGEDEYLVIGGAYEVEIRTL
ncbi:MAG: NAD(+)--dinitrogen-reductase ADP-D-ribosyltransferase [Rhodocyclaceae bacterium]|nr:NAD(+)--dinitrogen-reductase ADP-D-ribosyltransferase [Rhodocyclaceae bacterium]